MNRSELVTTLNLVSRALAKTDLIPIFKCFSFDGETVTASDDTLTVTAPCETTEDFAVSGSTLLGLLSNSQAKEVEFTIEDQDVVGKTGRSTFRLPFFPAEDFLFTPPKDNEFDVKLALAEPLWSGLQCCLKTVTDDGAHERALAGIYLNHSKKCVTLYSSNSDAITKFTTTTKSWKGAPIVGLPKSFCDALLRISKEIRGDDASLPTGQLWVNEEWAKATLTDGYVIYGRLIELEGPPPDFEGMIQKTLKQEPVYVKVPEELGNALARARVLADPETAKTVITVASDRLKLVTTTAMGVVRDSVVCPKHAEVEVNVSAAIMQAAIEHCDEMTLLENCCVFKKGDQLFVLTGNMS